MPLPGVKVGPLDPDSTAGFGQVSKNASARQIIRLHSQMHPPELRRALSRPLDPERTKGIDYDELEDYLGGLSHGNGDPYIPDGASVVGASVRGEPRTGQVLTYTYRLQSGRTGKWHAPYGANELPISFDSGAEFAKVKEMRDRGIVSFDSEGTRTEILSQQLVEARRESAALRKAMEEGTPAPERTGGDTDTRNGESLAEDLERTNRENEELKTELAQYRALHDAEGGGTATRGVEETIPGSGQGEQPTTVTQEPPFPEYEDMKADQLVGLLKSPETPDETRQAILDYEASHANRKSVVGAAQETLGSGS